MHELFITATISHGRVDEALRILQGYCGMTPVREISWRLTFEGPKTNPLSGISAQQLQTRRPSNLQLWKELDAQLVRQSYYVSASYVIAEDDFGRDVTTEAPEQHSHTTVDLQEAKGTLHFLDYPDPPGTRPVNSRLAIHIRDESHIPVFLGGIRYTYLNQHVRETWHAYRDNVTFALSRNLRVPLPSMNNDASETSADFTRQLPILADCSPFDGENKWTLTASVEVLDGNQPALMQRGIDQLQQMKQDLDEVCDLALIPRKQLDTRLPSYIQSIRA